MAPTTLSSLGVGRKARILEVGGEAALLQRLLEFGLLPGVVVKLVRVAPLGDPVEIEVLGYSLSLRKSEAAHVQIEPI
ncbi:ferrous iron transport protein A [bacterium]|nr:MAG: ferrous iron transport protein A [bacterium]RIK63101.1 MAG: ferrous iron transport protein A [Planctomycetota bacterium]